MAQKKKTRAVNVVKTERYVDEVPVEEVEEPETVETDDSGPLDPIDELFAEVDANRTMRMFVWCLSEFKRNGLRGRRAPGAEYVCDFPFTEVDALTYPSTIQARYPTGGMFYIEVRGDFIDKNGVERNGIIKSWSEQIAAVPGYQTQGQQQQGPYPIIVSTPAPPNHPQQPVPAPVDPTAIMREHMSLAREMVSMAKDLMPQPPPININGSEQGGEEKQPFEDRLLETVVTKALETDTSGSRLDKVLDALGGRKQQSNGFMDALGEIAKGLVPLAAQFGMAYLRSQQMATGQPLQPTQQEQAALPPAAPAFNVPDNPGDRAWFFCVRHLFENCTNGMPAKSTAGEICDVLDAHQHLEPIVEPVLMAETPEQAVELLALVDPRCEQLKGHASALAWVAKVQEEAKGMLSEGQEGEGGGAL